MSVLAHASVRPRAVDAVRWLSAHRAVLPLAVALALLAVALLGFEPQTAVAVYFLSALVVLAAIDIEQRRLPNVIVLPSAALVLAAQIAIAPDRTLEWVAASVGTFLALLVLAVVYPGGMGMGDVKLGLLLGAGLGAAVLNALLIGFLAGGIAGIALIAVRGVGARKSTIPFGPFLAFGAAVALLLGG